MAALTSICKNGASGSKARRSVHRRHLFLEREMRSKWVGPMPVEDFFNEFMPVSKDVLNSCPKVSNDFFKTVSTMEKESTMYGKWLEIMSTKEANFLPGYKLVNTSNKPGIVGSQRWDIDVTCYREDVDVSKHVNQLDKAEWGIEFRISDSDDPFGDRENFVDYDLDTPAGKKARESRGVLAMYAAEWFSHQHRTHVFTIFVSKTHARLLYFDRSGAVVTERFNYDEDATPLVRFMWYFKSLTLKQRGLDNTVRMANDDQAIEYRSILNSFHKRVAMLEVKPQIFDILKAKKGERSGDDLTDADWEILWNDVEGSIEHSLAPDELDKVTNLVQDRMPSDTATVVIIQVPDGSGYREVIGQWYSSSAESLVGRSTRAWPVWDPVSKKLLYLKDSWRLGLANFQEESCILKELNYAGVNHVPHLICGGDVETQKTHIGEITSKGKQNGWVCGKFSITTHIHHRFLVDFIGRPIKYFSHSKQMLQAVYDAFNAHREAWNKCGILHRDISENNVMLDRWGRGVLNDWDMAKKVQKDETEHPRAHARTGTWHFMSTMLLQHPKKTHTVYDDWESFVLLVLYLALSFLHHSHISGLGEFMYTFFEECEVDPFNSTFKGGNKKFSVLQTDGTFVKQFKVINNKPLEMWFSSVLFELAKWVNWLNLMHNFPVADPAMLKSFKKVQDVKFDDEDFLSSMFQKALKLPGWPAQSDKTFNDVFRPRDIYRNTTSSTITGNKHSRHGGSSCEAKDVKKQKLVTSGVDVLQEVH